MRKVIALLVLFNSVSLFAKCPVFFTGKLEIGQKLSKVVLSDAYKFEKSGEVNAGLAIFLRDLKKAYPANEQYIDARMISELLLEQDEEGSICPKQKYISYDKLETVISGRIFDLYYGCGCDH